MEWRRGWVLNDRTLFGEKRSQVPGVLSEKELSDHQKRMRRE